MSFQIVVITDFVVIERGRGEDIQILEAAALQ